MSSVFRPWVTYHVKDGHRVKAGTPGARKKRVRCKTWYGQYRDADGTRKRVPLGPDKSAAQTLLTDLVRKSARRQAGMVDPYEEAAKKPLGEHLAAYSRFLESKARDDKYLTQIIQRIERVAAACKFRRLADIQAGPVVDWIESLKDSGRSHATCNRYLTALKQFCRWAVRDRRAPDSPLAHLSKVNEETDVRLERRALSPAEFAALLDAARQSPALFRGLSGADRGMLYTLAAYTGFRASELGSLTPASLSLTADPPTVEVEAAYSKRGRRDVQPLPTWLADRLTDWLTDKGIGRAEKLWPGSWPGRAAEMLRADLRSARARSIWEAKARGERKRRWRSAFLLYRDEDGRVFDFHALRHQFISNLAAAGVHPKTAQQLARHSTITLTMNRYTHLAVADLTGALDRLPELPDPAAQEAVLQPTGTDLLAPVLAPPGAFSRNFVASNGTSAGEPAGSQETRKPLKNKGFQADGPGFEPGLDSRPEQFSRLPP